MSASSVLYAPFNLWDLYVEYLWNYKPGSWVERTASTFRVFAFVVITPFILLTLLVRELSGVIDVTKASTSEATPSRETHESPSIHVQDESLHPQADEAKGDPSSLNVPPAPESYLGDTVVEEGNLKLSGVNVFSPAPSQPPSPTLSRRDLSSHMQPQLQSLTTMETPRRPRSDTTLSSTHSSSGESNFTMVDKESGSDDAEGTQIRRRGRPADNGFDMS
ncbi:hypothetical protein PHLCEN_2v6526 [Hermanssonia centrifuga]|uniref:Uncharacterized protein n=1 Tax=Hermanssonia centrifuga TaxID=98765 RepID=A0A2R6NZE9_9APHY|nr:hypothetical protein PHLCEN_2v6526 [Hermanssonia centrifuga]